MRFRVSFRVNQADIATEYEVVGRSIKSVLNNQRHVLVELYGPSIYELTVEVIA